MPRIATLSMIRFADHRRDVAGQGVWEGDQGMTPYFARCRDEHETGTRVIFSRDTGHHTSGWWKNPDYERCLHLSLSFWDPVTGLQRPFEDDEADVWVRLFFGPYVNLIWQESAVTDGGRELGLRHYRVFCDERWRPIKPRGEVYTTRFTELGWKSWSDVQAARKLREVQRA